VIPVSSLDAAMLYAETPEMPMHTMGVVVLDTPPEPPFEVMRRTFEQRVHLVAPLRRRLVEGPFQLCDPHWIEAPDFDLDNHLRRAALPSPGGTRELAELVGELAGRPLERSRPLWEMVLVEGVEGGRIAVVAKVHHAAMDGGRAVALLLGCLFDASPAGTAVPPPRTRWTPEPEPSLAWLAADTARSLAAKPIHAVRAVADVAATILDGLLARRGGDAGAARLFEAPATPFNGALTRHRCVALADVDFGDVLAIKRAFATTVNDVVLAGSCASLRSWLLAHGGVPDRPLVVNVPVAVRGEGEESAGNRVSMLLVHLPVQLDDALERLMAIRAETRRAKRQHGHGRGDVLQQFTDVLTNITVPWLLTHLMELYSSTRIADRLPFFWNLVISNLPGPRAQLYCAGAKVRKIYPLGPVQQGSGLNLTVLSTLDRLCLGAMACKEMVPDVEDIGSGFADEIAVLSQLARATA
jgi:diacylglycerol O-acyltransferase / wax synthase